MQSKSDTQLLREYAEQDSEAAFGEIVSRHTDFVYSAALRQVGSPDLAHDVAQNVFTELARKAASLLGRSAQSETLSGWLYQSARYSALMLLRTNRRRQEREREAMDQTDPGSEEASDWTQVGPVLDQAMSHLSIGDRDALLLRFFKNQDYRAIGTALGVSDDTAQKRVSRALEKLRTHLARNNIATSAVALSATLSAHAVQVAPTGLAASLATASLAGVAAVTGAGSGSTFFTLLVMTKLKIIGTMALLAAAITIPLWQQSRLQKAETEIAQLRTSAAELAKLRPEIERLQKKEVDYAELERLRGAEAQAQSEIAKLRGRVSNTRRVDTDNAQLKASLDRVAPFSEAMTNAMAQGLNHAMTFFQNEDRKMIARMKEALHLSDDQERSIRDSLVKYREDRSEITRKVITRAISGEDGDRMIKAMGGTDEKITAFLSPEQLAGFPEFKQNETAMTAQTTAKSEAQSLRNLLGLSEEQETKASEALYRIALTQSSAPPPADLKNPSASLSGMSDVMTLQLEKKLQALEGILTPEQLKNYHDREIEQINMRAKILDSVKGMFPGANVPGQK